MDYYIWIIVPLAWLVLSTAGIALARSTGRQDDEASFAEALAWTIAFSPVVLLAIILIYVSLFMDWASKRLAGW